MKEALHFLLKYTINTKKFRTLDFVDRCCCHYTPIVLSILMFIVGTIDIFGKPLYCMVPTEFSETWVAYVHQFCYVSGTYVKSYDHDGNNQRVYVDYYQWVPFLLVVQAVLMHFPHFFWRFGQTKTDIDFHHIHSLALKVRNESEGKRLETVEQAAKYIYRIAKHRDFKGVGNMTLTFYITFKFLNILTIIAMIYFLTTFVGYRNPFWGITLARQVWHSSEHNLVEGNQPFSYFPRIAYCMFGADAVGSLDGGMRRETRCVLGINVLNEKVFLLLYFWYYILLTITIMNLICFARFISVSYRVHFVNNFLRLVNHKTVCRDSVQHVSKNEHSMQRFTKYVLGQDGVLLVHFLQQNMGKLVAVEICSLLYHIANQSSGTIKVQIAHTATERGENSVNGKKSPGTKQR